MPRKNGINAPSGTQESLVKSVVEADLQNRVTELQRQLRDATDALSRMRGTNGGETRNEIGDLVTTSPAPHGKRGYLFKWQDRSIGWGGTKWSLRFVQLDRGNISYYATHTDLHPRYELTLRGCAVRDEGVKRNRRHISKDTHEPPIDEGGAYFHLFSIYQRPDAYEKDASGSASDSDGSTGNEVSEVVPLLRFSTPSLAEKSQWLSLISEACAYCDTDEFVAEEANLAIEHARRREQARTMAAEMPEAQKGTLPPLYFAPPPPPKLRRVPSGSRMTKPRFYRTTSGNLNAENVEGRSTTGYPPSKPMHRSAAPSYLSPDAPLQNYRGLFNLGMILLVLSNFRILLDVIRRHGFFIVHLPQYLPSFASHDDPWADFPVFSGFVLLQKFVLICFAVELALSKKRLPELIGMALHHLNIHLCLAAEVVIVWNFVDNPVKGGFLLMSALICWMKLISFVLANQDYRLSGHRHHATLAIVENLDAGASDLAYPHNVTIPNLYYFLCAPTLTYQIAFPRSPSVRTWKVVSILVRMSATFALFMFLVAQSIGPNLKNLVRDLEATKGVLTPAIVAEYGLRLSLTNTYAWLLIFYFYFHLFLNLCAEILRFGDRVFYKDWWNASEVSAYWRLWNMPVHYWLVRHVYFPCVRLGLSRVMATCVVFFLSAILHEVVISVPFHMMKPWSFLGIMMQLPLVFITKYLGRHFPGSFGNVIFWLSFCVVGQPMAILLYTVDYQYGKEAILHGSILSDVGSQQCPVRWGIQLPCFGK